jgi:hypothetical protein
MWAWQCGEKMAMIPPKPEDLVTFDTAPAMEEKRQHPRAINICGSPERSRGKQPKA